MTSIEYLSGFWGISLCSWGLFAFLTSFRIRNFIIKRYEQETNLLDTIYFREHAVFTRYMPSLISSPLYVAHLISILWMWNYCKKKRPYRDIKDAKDITQLFSEKEIRRVKLYVTSGIILIFHGIAYVIFRLIWPEEFS